MNYNHTSVLYKFTKLYPTYHYDCCTIMTTEPAPAVQTSLPTSEPPLASSAQPPKPGYVRHQAMYQFDARNTDELSLKVGDIIWVSAAVTISIGLNYGLNF